MPDKADNARKGLFNRLNRSMNSLYTTTYYSPPGNSNSLDNLRDRINGNIDRIVNQNMDMVGTPSVSRLYSRMKFDLDSQSHKNGRSVNTLFDNAIGYDDFFASFQSNRYLVEMDAEIDSTCKYFPELEEAIAVMKEGVLSPDYFSKDYLSMTCSAYSGDKQDTFNELAKDLKKRYKLLPLVEEVYYNTSKYGEDFLYIVPYSTALSRLLTQKPNTTIANARIEHEATGDFREEVPLTESFTLSLDKEGFKITDSTNKVVTGFSDSKPTVYTESVEIEKGTGKETVSNSHPLMGDNDSFKIDIEISRKGIIESVVENARKSYRSRNFIESTESQFFNEASKSELKIVKPDKKTGKLVIDGIEDEVKDDLTANDGLVPTNMNTSVKEVKVDVPGCVVSRIRREQVIPIYIGENNTCLGYYYIELRSYEALEDFRGLNYIMSDSLTSLRGSNSGMNAPFNCVDPSRQEEMLKYVAGQLSQFIDKEFVQANQDLREEIYMILKYNDTFNTPAIDKVKISFVPPEDMIHVYFKLDPITHRGISDLDKSMVPAKIYASMYITQAIGELVRGQDKRVFYVKQTVDSNIAQTLMNVINQVKQGNFGFRQFSNINNVLNITGKFNDFFIPVGASGDSPIDIQTIPGQQFTDNSDRMQQLKEMAVNATGVPFEIIQTRLSVDYAAQLSMSNSKFLRKVYARQSIFAPYLSRLCTKLFNYEYKEKCEVEVILPPPVFINTANTMQLVDNTKNFVNSIAEVELVNGETDEQKAEYIKRLFYFYIGTHIDISRHEAILKKALQEVEAKANKTQEDNGY